MSASPRGPLLWGLILGVLLCLAFAGLLHLRGYSFMYMGPAAAPSAGAAPAQAERKIKYWQCPMHPQVIKPGPGKCPICGMELAPVYEEAAPAAPAPAPAPGGKKPAPAAGAPKSEAQELYTCPMHPEVVQHGPGKCPKCGMELAPIPGPGAATPPPAAQKPAPATGAPPKAAKQLYRCPMHPQIVREAPGKCPICGMELVPVPPGAAPVPAPSPAPPPAGQQPGPAAGAQKKETKQLYRCPMHPEIVRHAPGKCPICGMELVPVPETGAQAPAAQAPGVIAVSPATVQSMGVRTARVEVRPLSHDTWTVGRVTVNERNLAIINTKVSGWVERLYVNATGDPVRRGQTLLAIYSPDLVSTQKEYLLAFKNLKTMQKAPFPELGESARNLLEASRRRLQYFDISAGQIEALERTGQVKRLLTLSSPATGIVTKRMVTEGAYVQAGMPLLEVADLATVWVDADIYQYELPWIKKGQPVEMSLQYLPGETFKGKIDYIYPYLKEETRTVRVRLRFANPRLKLKPDMFAQVQVKSPVTRQAVVVPVEAVLDTGLKQHVFIALGGGQFEPREVKLGVYGNGNHYREVLSGLQGGEEVVTSAQFLLDSESRFREAVQLMGQPQAAPGQAAPAQQPMPGMPGMNMEAPKGTAPPAPAPLPPGHKH